MGRRSSREASRTARAACDSTTVLVGLRLSGAGISSPKQSCRCHEQDHTESALRLAAAQEHTNSQRPRNPRSTATWILTKVTKVAGERESTGLIYSLNTGIYWNCHVKVHRCRDRIKFVKPHRSGTPSSSLPHLASPNMLLTRLTSSARMASRPARVRCTASRFSCALRSRYFMHSPVDPQTRYL